MEFTSARLHYRLLEQRDRDEFVALYQDPKVMQKIGPVMKREQAEEFFKSAIRFNESTEQRQKIWLVSNLSSLASCGILMIKWQRNSEQAELGIILKPASSGKELATEAVDTVIRFARHVFLSTHFLARFDRSHVPVMRILTKLNFTFVHLEEDEENRQVTATLILD